MVNLKSRTTGTVTHPARTLHVNATDAMEHNAEDDVFGEHLLELIQQSPFFQNKNCILCDESKRRMDSIKSFYASFCTGLSLDGVSRNVNSLYQNCTCPEWRLLQWRRIEYFINHYKEKSPEELREEFLTFVRHCLIFEDFVPTWENCLFLVFARLIPLTVLPLALISSFALVWTIQYALLFGFFMSFLFIDWKEFRRSFENDCPDNLKNLTKTWTDAWKTMDRLYFLGNRFVGREWDGETFVWNVHNQENAFIWYSPARVPPSQSCNESTTLWDLPPPSVAALVKNSSDKAHVSTNPDALKLQSVDPLHLNSQCSRWSRETAKHVAAIDFCYVLLAEEVATNPKLRKGTSQKKKSNTNGHNTSVDLTGSMGIGQDIGRSLSPCRSGEIVSDIICHDRDLITVVSHNQYRSFDTSMEVDSPGSFRESIELRMHQTSPRSYDEDRDDLHTPTNAGTLSDDEVKDDLDLPNVNTIPSDVDLPWIDVGVKVGKLLLNSAPLHRAIASQQTTERLLGIKANFGGGKDNEEASEHETSNRDNVTAERSQSISENDGPRKDNDAVPKRLSKPIHPMWTSPAAAGSHCSPNCTSPGIDHDENNGIIEHSTCSGLNRELSVQLSSRDLPPKSPSSRRFVDANELELNTISPTQSLTPISTPGFHHDRKVVVVGSDTISETGSIEVSLVAPILSYLSPGISKSHDSDSGLVSKSKAALHAPSHHIRKDGNQRRKEFRRKSLLPGVKVAIPLFPLNPSTRRKPSQNAYAMATVVSSKRIMVASGYEKSSDERVRRTNCLSVTAKMENFFLRDGEFAELTFRVLDTWSQRYMPRHSKVPVGSCVATLYGIGVLVGWRVEDDCHVVRSLWQRRGAGSSHAYLNRRAIHGVTAAAVGFTVQTVLGWGNVLGCVNSGPKFDNCSFYVAIKEDGRQKDNPVLLERKQILSCPGAQFIPVTEHLREAVNYQLQVDNYNASVREQRLSEVDPPVDQEFSIKWDIWAEILWSSFLKAVEEDKDFDSNVSRIMDSVIEFLEKLDSPVSDDEIAQTGSNDFGVEISESEFERQQQQSPEPELWFMNDLFGGILAKPGSDASPSEPEQVDDEQPPVENKIYSTAFGMLRILMKTVSIARASSVDHPHLRLALAIFYDFLLFVRTVIRVQQQNITVQSLDVWKQAWREIISTFGPLKDRLERVGFGIAQRMKTQGRKAKLKVLKFADKIFADDRLLRSLELGDWDRCLAQIEIALVEAHVIEEENLIYYRKVAQFLFDHLRLIFANEGNAATRNSEKLAILASLVQAMAKPLRSIMKLLCSDEVLELFERILVRAYHKEEVATRMLTIHAANFHTLRHLRMLKYFPISGRIWIPLLDAADEEFTWLVSNLPESSKEFMCPLSSLFSLCVVQFHRINAGDLSTDWLEFLLEDEAASIIHDLDMKALLAMESFARDVKETMVVLPYYSSIDDDFLNLMDEVDITLFLKEASEALDNPESLSKFIRDKATISIERFLNYLPKLSIPVEKRELGDGWVLTCRSEDGSDLRLSGLNIKRENLVCQVMGGDTLLFPMFCDDDVESISSDSLTVEADPVLYVQESVLDHIRDLIVSAQSHGCWKPGAGGVGEPSSDPYIASVLQDLPVSSILSCGIDLWRNLEIDDDELLEIAIRDVSYQIQLENEREDEFETLYVKAPAEAHIPSTDSEKPRLKTEPFFERRFNPRLDPTLLYLDVRNLNLCLTNFRFRIEKIEKKTIFDPIFEGKGTISLENVSICLRINCAKEIYGGTRGGLNDPSPVLQLQELNVGLEKLRIQVKDTGFGSDWILNKAVDVFEDQIRTTVEANLKEQLHTQISLAIENLNSYFVSNPNILLRVLGISIDDLDYVVA